MQRLDPKSRFAFYLNFLTNRPSITEKTLEVAYFSMEVALRSGMSTYSGGLGVLAGDTLKTFADFGYSALGITLLHEQGYVEQEIDSTGRQTSQLEMWDKEEYVTKLPFTLEVPFNDRSVICAVWQYNIVGQSNQTVPVYFLDSNVPENNQYDRALTSYLYGGDAQYRLCQEYILGIGGLLLLEKLGLTTEKVRVYHLNEGHASFVGLSLYEQAKKVFPTHTAALDHVHAKLVFTTHTPIEAGHDRFLIADVEKVLPTHLFQNIPQEALRDDQLWMTRLSLHFAGVVTGVAKSHEQVTQAMFPEHDIVSVTNGAYHLEWTHPEFKKLYDQYIPGWRLDPSWLRKALGIPDEQIWATHTNAKKKLIDHVNTISPNALSVDVCTLGYARRFTSYKRPTLILADLDALEKKIASVGPLQIIFAGEAHPHDQESSELLGRIFQKIQNHEGKITIVFLEDYDMDLAASLVAGVDIWLNTPLQKHEASGTSGMKAALNAVPHLSVLDGWWPEGWIEGVTGWAIGTNATNATLDDEVSWQAEVNDLYKKLATKILPLYYQNRPEFIKILKHAAAINGSYFTTYRMVGEYISQLYFSLPRRSHANPE